MAWPGACLAAGLAASAAFADGRLPRVSDSIIQVGIVHGAPSLTLRPEGDFSVLEQGTGRTFSLEPRDYTLDGRAGSGIAFGRWRLHGRLRLLPNGPGDGVRVGGKRYRGNLSVLRNADGTLTVVEELGIEEYLYGVLPAEMSPDWPMEALKAQAVVARSFALNNLGKFQSSGFDLSGDTRSQAYTDAGRRYSSVQKAVDSTEGELLSWRGKPLQAYFHSCCGGRTSSASAIWGSEEGQPRPLRGVSDRACGASPHYQWSAYFADEDVLSALRRHRIPVARIRNIRVGRRDSSGYAKTLLLSADRTTLELRANDFRNWLGNSELKSTHIVRIKRMRRGFAFAGRGFGHGVGLCQWGARALARRGYDYRRILAHYFPGAGIEKREW